MGMALIAITLVGYIEIKVVRNAQNKNVKTPFCKECLYNKHDYARSKKLL